MDPDTIPNEEFSIDFNLNCGENKTFTKNWEIQLVSSIKNCFYKVTASINTMTSHFSNRFDDLEVKLRDDITGAASEAGAAHAIAIEAQNDEWLKIYDLRSMSSNNGVRS